MPDTAASLCRICYSPCCGQADCVHHNCGCKGSVGHAHPSCIRKWIVISGNTRCHLCTQKFNLLVRRPRVLPRNTPGDDDDEYDDLEDPNALYRIDPKTFTWAIFILCLFRFLSTPQ